MRVMRRATNKFIRCVYISMSSKVLSQGGCVVYYTGGNTISLEWKSKDFHPGLITGPISHDYSKAYFNDLRSKQMIRARNELDKFHYAM